MTDACSINYTKSAESMELKGAMNMLSLKRYDLRYVHYIGDGDTEPYKKVVDAKLYSDFTRQ